MKINLISPDIYEIEDFLSVDQKKAVKEYYTSLDESDWWISVNDNNKKSFFYGKQIIGGLPSVFAEIDNKIANLFSNFSVMHPIVFQRHHDEEPMAVHKDYYKPDPESYIRFGIVVYYNDDYTGGEIFYPSLEILHKPKAGSLVMHGGNIKHGTKPVTDGSHRYFSTTFARGSVAKPVVLNSLLFGDIEQPDGSKYP